MIYKLKQTEKAAALFAGWQETMIWSCLQGVMGSIYADSLEVPVSAMALLGDFCFLVGKPDKELVFYERELEQREFRIMVPQDREWAELIRDCHGEKAKEVVRYALKKEPETFDRVRLQAFVNELPQGYTLKTMDKTLFYHCGKMVWCRDWTAQYRDYTTYQKYGLGAVILQDGEPVSGASSYSGYNGGIEIEIDTREDHRRKGLARVCGAKLILECLNRGWYPSWDAQNQWSLALARQLGYHFSHEYKAYEIIRSGSGEPM